MSQLFASAWAKIERAEEQIIGVNRDIEAFLGEPPYGAKRVVYSDVDEVIESVVELHARREVPLRFGVVVGEIVHNLRSSLDHVANALVLAANREPSRRTAFPIFTADPAGDKKSVARFAACVKGMSPMAKAIVEQLQPYKRALGAPDDEPLAMLAELCNRDKHRKLNIAVSGVVASSKKFFFEIPEDGTEADGDSSVGHLSVDVGAKLTAQISLEEQVGLPYTSSLIETLERISEEVRDVVAIFSKVFGQPG